MRKTVTFFVLMLISRGLCASTYTKIGDLYYALYPQVEIPQAHVARENDNNQMTMYQDLVAPTIPTSITTSNNVTYPVLAIGYMAFSNCPKLETVHISTSITTIQASAFRNSKCLRTIHIPDNVTTLGEGIFEGCSGLTHVELPFYLKRIPSYTFSGCTSLNTIEITYGIDTIGVNAFSGCTGLKGVYITDLVHWASGILFGSNPLEYAHHLYVGAGEVTNLVIPNGVSAINRSAFAGGSSFTSLSLPNSLHTIDQYAFSGCTGLTSVTIPASVVSMKSNAFYGCSNITSVTINSPTVLKENGSLSQVFGKQVKEYILGESIKSIHARAFYQIDSLTSVVMSNGVKIIGDYAFAECHKLKQITWPLSLDSIGNYAFNQCDSLKFVEIPEKVTYIGDYVFMDCDSITTLVVGDGVKSIGYGSFYRCHALSSVTLGDGLTSIGGRAFEYCSSLSTLSLGDSIEYIGNDAFSQCGYMKKLQIKSVAGWCKIRFADQFANPLQRANHLYIGDVEVTDVVVPSGQQQIHDYAFNEARGIQSVSIPGSVRKIGDYAFNGCLSLTSLSIDEGLRSIGYHAFYNCKFTSVTIPNTVDTIGKAAFLSCKNLKSVTIGSSVKIIRDDAFNDCVNLDTIYNRSLTPQSISLGVFNGVQKDKCVLVVPKGTKELYRSADVWKTFRIMEEGGECFGTAGVCGENLKWEITCDSSKLIISGSGKMTEVPGNWTLTGKVKNVLLPEGVTSICSGAFSSCPIEKLTIPSTVDTIGSYAFGSILRFLYSKALIPPVVNGGSYMSSNAQIIVPRESVDLYKVAPFWKNFRIFPEGECVVDDGDCGVSLNWSLNCDTTELTITGSGKMYSYSWNSAPWYEYRNKIKKIHLSDEMTYVGQYAFYGCSVDTIIIPESVNSIGTGAFMNCSKLRHCHLGSNLQIINAEVFYGCSSIEYLSIPENVWYIKEGALPVGMLKSITVAENNVNFTTEDGVLFDSNKTILYKYPSAMEGTTYTVPIGVTRIANGAFNLCDKLRTIHISDSVKTLGSSAFAYSYYLDSITLPAGLTAIENYTFNSCRSLQSVTLPGALESIGNGAFENCKKLSYIICKANISPTCGDDVFYGVNTSIPLYVPRNSMNLYKASVGWEEFIHIQALQAEESEVIGIQVEPSSTSVIIEWTKSDDAVLYTIIIKKGIETIYTLSFNSNGQLTNIMSVASPRYRSKENAQTRNALQTSTGWKYTITGLEADTEYSYSVIAQRTDNSEAYNQTIPFRTEQIATSIDTMDAAVNCGESRKILRNGYLYILRDGKEFNVLGQSVR